jgi:outer membrane protein
MKFSLRMALAAALGSLFAASGAHAADLLSVYQDALKNDPAIREADALRLATREQRPQAWAALLPNITGQASKGKETTDGIQQFAQIQPVDPINDPDGPQALFVFSRTGESEPETDQWSLDLRQNIFSWTNWVALRRASHQVAQAEADYAAAQQDLISRVSTAYFNVLAARDTLEAEQAAGDAISRQLEQTEKRFEVGLIAITDVQDARAARDTAAANVIAAKRALATFEEQLREITGQKYDVLNRPTADMPLKSPEPASEDQWVQQSLDQNLALISSRLNSDIARDNVRSAFGGHLPTLDLVASKGNFNQDTPQVFPADPANQFPGGAVTTTTDQDSESYTLQLNVPIFSGGLTQSRVRESQYRWIAAKEQFVRVSRATERAARDAYMGVMSEISRVNALRQALASSQTSLQATEAGYEVGTRTAVDVLDARRALVLAQSNFARSRYDYLLNVINLRLAAGNLDDATLTEINSTLTDSTPTPSTNPTPTPPPAQ